MVRVEHHGHGVYCEVCEEVHDGTGGCDHRLDRKMGVLRSSDGFIAKPADMSHFSPHMWVDVDGMEQCSECGAVKLSEEMVESRGCKA